jgi:hypothetical protein
LMMHCKTLRAVHLLRELFFSFYYHMLKGPFPARLEKMTMSLPTPGVVFTQKLG